MRILFVGGGTLGSVTPLLAVAEELGCVGDRSGGLSASDGFAEGGQAAIRDAPLAPKRGELKFAATFWGTKHGPERVLVEAAGIPFRTIPSGKLRRYFDVRNIMDLFVMEWAFWVSLARLLADRPSVVVGAGSFVQVPVMWAAWFLRIPIVIHQLDVRPGLANRLCAPIARAITVTFPESTGSFWSRACRDSTVTKMDDRPKLCTRHEQRKTGDTVLDGRLKLCHSDRGCVWVIGAPVRRAVLAARGRDSRSAKRAFGFSGDRPVLLVLGGGTGAQALNDLVAGALPQLTAVADVVHVTGKQGHQSTNAHQSTNIGTNLRTHARSLWIREHSWIGAPISAHYQSFELLTDLLPDALAAADLVVSRAGMGTIAELGALGKPTVLVPMPDTHQEENAAALEVLGAVQVWHQRDLTSLVFAERVRAMLNDTNRRTALGAAFARVFPSDAAAALAEVVQKWLR